MCVGGDRFPRHCGSVGITFSFAVDYRAGHILERGVTRHMEVLKMIVSLVGSGQCTSCFLFLHYVEEKNL